MRRPQNGTRTVSLFPFLSVLFSLLGTLMFIGVGIASTALESAKAKVILHVDEMELPGTSREPVLVDVGAERAVVVGTGREFGIEYERARAEVARRSGTPYSDFLREIGDRRDRYVIFVVRPQGIESFRVLRWILETLNRKERGGDAVRFGVELIPADWKVTLKGTEGLEGSTEGGVL